VTRTQVVVVGAGHLGRIHSRLLREREDCELVGVVDPVSAAREQVAHECNITDYTSLAEVPFSVDAAVIAAPTGLHHQVAMELIDRDCHLLIEKPMTVSLEEADELVERCSDKNLVLQVGHVERFNSVLDVAQGVLRDAKFIQATRTSGFTGRSVDIGAVHDLMIHDLDLVMAIAEAEVVDVEAMGVTVLGPHEDMAHARLTFANGCIANLNASRTSFVAKRELESFGPFGFCKLDFATKEATVVRPSPELMQRQVDVNAMTAVERAELHGNLFETLLPLETLPAPENNAIADEHTDFLSAIQKGTDVRVSGADARRVLAVASRILSSIASHQWVGQPFGPVGPLVQVPPLRKAG